MPFQGRASLVDRPVEGIDEGSMDENGRLLDQPQACLVQVPEGSDAGRV